MKAVFMSTLCVIALLCALLAVRRFANQTLEVSPPTAAATAALKQLWTCGMHPQVIQDHPGFCPICHMKLVPLNMAASADSSVRVDPTVVQNMGILTAGVVRGPLTVTVRAVGMLQVPEPATHDVTLKISGYVEKLYADTDGMAVRKGDVLFDLYSSDLQVAEQELIGAEQDLRALHDKSSDSVRQDAVNLVESAKEKLRLWDVAEHDIDALAAADHPPRTVPFRSPVDGHIMDKTIVAGSAVMAGTKLMGIEDHSKLWLDAEIYEEQIPLVKNGDEVVATVDAVPGKTFTGTISFIYPHLDHMARTETVRTVLDNPGHELSPGMYASVQIKTQAVPDAVLAPREAVIDTGTRQIAFVLDPSSAGHFLPRDVRMGISGDNDMVQIVQGLAPGDQVVTSGQFLLDVESRTTEAIQKLRGNPPATLPAAGTELIHSVAPMGTGQ